MFPLTYPVLHVYRQGDLFCGQLPEADLYLMSRVLHDW